MKNANFCLRVISLALIVGAIITYNGNLRITNQETEITALTQKLESMEKQQAELLEAIEADYEARTQTVTEEPDNEPSGEGIFKDGTYTGEGTGFGGTIQVQVTLEDEQITDIQILSAEGEDRAYLELAKGLLTTIIDEQSTAVDTVSGATFSSTGILEAVNNALEKAAEA